MMPSALDVWAVVRIFVFGKDVGGSLRPYGACTSPDLPPSASASFKKFFPVRCREEGKAEKGKIPKLPSEQSKRNFQSSPLPHGSIKRFTAVRLDVCLAAFYSSQLQQKSMKTVANQIDFVLHHVMGKFNYDYAVIGRKK